MPFGKELSHLIEEQIGRAVENKTFSTNSTGISSSAGGEEGMIAQLEANLQKLAEKFTDLVSSQKKSKRNVVDYGLNVIALHDLRLAVTAGRAIFVDRTEPLDVPYTYLQLSSAGTERQIRYVYLNNTGVVTESTTDPTNIGTGYIPLAMVDVWAGITEIIQDKIKNIRPRSGADESTSSNETSHELTGNVTVSSPDTGNDSFVVAAVNPAGLKVKVSSGRALIAGEMLNAEGGNLDLTNHCKVVKEFIAFSDGMKKNYNLYHKSVADVEVYVNDAATPVSVDAAKGAITFDTAPLPDGKITASYTFSGNYMLVFLVERAQTNDGKSFGVIGWKVGSNRTSTEPPDLTRYQHAIAKIDISSSIMTITDSLIDNSYEVKNLTQSDLQYGGKLNSSSINSGAIDDSKLNAAVSAALVKARASASAADLSVQADKINSVVTELSKPIDQCSYTALTQVKDAINLRVKSSDFNGQNIVSQINVSPSGTLIDGKLLHVTGQTQFDDNVIVNRLLTAGCVDAAKISAGAITTAKIAAGAIITTQLAAKSVTGDKIVAGAVTADKISAKLAEIPGQITAGQIAAGSITADKIATGAITANNIAAGAITSDKIGAGQITADNIAAGSIDATKISRNGALINVVVMVKGTVAHGTTIPLPTGYTESQCMWGTNGGITGSAGGATPDNVYVDINRTMYAVRKGYTSYTSANGQLFPSYIEPAYGSACYWILGVR